jgi:hypothetical protein
MGCAASRGVNPIDAALLQALIEAKKRRARSRQTLTFNELLLKFPKVRTRLQAYRLLVLQTKVVSYLICYVLLLYRWLLASRSAANILTCWM